MSSWRGVGFVLCAAVVLLPSREVFPQRLPDRPVDSFRRAYAQARTAESDLTATVIGLDDRVRRAAFRFSPDLSRQEAELHARDLALNRALERAYALALRRGDAASDADLTRTALLHWSSLLRRRSMGKWHTVVPGLVDDARCRGDLIGDEMLQKYFDTLFDTSDTSRNERLAVAALAELARQSACLGQQQTAILASNLYWSFAEVRSFLTANNLQRIIPAVVEAGAAPLLLFYDVEKDRGPGSPLARWFTENERQLVQGAVTQRIPMTWHGLWLYDRRSGYLRGFRINRRPVDENEADLVALFASIVRTENLGDFSCPFSEMLQRGPSEHGYLCAAASCQKAAEMAGANNRIPGVARPNISRVAFGHSLSFFNQITCSEGRGDRTGSSGGGPCAAGRPPGGRESLTALFNCVANLRMNADQRFMRCLAEATGRCSNPVDRYTKNIQDAYYRGVPLGACTISGTQRGTGTSDPPGTLYTDDGIPLYPLVDYEANYEAALKNEESAENGVDLAEKHLDDADAAMKEAMKDSSGSEEAQKKMQDAYRTLELVQEALKKAKQEAEEAKKKREAAEKDLKDAQEKTDESKKAAEGRCPKDTPECGDNRCTAMSAQMMALQSCADARAAWEQPKVPGVEPFDPSPDSPDTSAAAALCFDAGGTKLTNERCWAVRCTENGTTSRTAAGDCVCGPSISEGGIGTAGDVFMCGGFLNCPEGSFQEGCRCVSYGNNPPFPGPTPKGALLSVSAPPTYSDVHMPRTNR